MNVIDTVTISRDEYNSYIANRAILNAIYAYVSKAGEYTIAEDVKLMIESMQVLPMYIAIKQEETTP